MRAGRGGRHARVALALRSLRYCRYCRVLRGTWDTDGKGVLRGTWGYCGVLTGTDGYCGGNVQYRLCGEVGVVGVPSDPRDGALRAARVLTYSAEVLRVLTVARWLQRRAHTCTLTHPRARAQARRLTRAHTPHSRTKTRTHTRKYAQAHAREHTHARAHTHARTDAGSHAHTCDLQRRVSSGFRAADPCSDCNIAVATL